MSGGSTRQPHGDPLDAVGPLVALGRACLLMLPVWACACVGAALVYWLFVR